VSAVSRDDLRIVSEATYSASNVPSRARKIVETGDTIFATVRPTLRRIAQIPASLDGEIVSTAFCVLRPDPQAIDADFLYFATQLESVMEGIASMESGASYPAVRDVDVLNQVVPLPPLPEQREIAAVLNTIRTASLHQAQCEANATALKRAAIRELFTRGLRGEAQKETEIGPVPESWEAEPIEELTSVVYRYPTYYRINYTDRGIPEVRGELLKDSGEIEEDLSQFRFIDAETALRFPKVRLDVGDIVMSVRGTMGKIGIARDVHLGAVITANLIRLAPDRQKILPEFFKSTLISERFIGALEMASPQTTIKTITAPVLKSLRLPIPPTLEEQHEIVSILNAIDRKIDLHRRKRAVLNDLFKALLHKLMTREIRVDDLDLPYDYTRK
jgi:type I restriction enzyme S subunit